MTGKCKTCGAPAKHMPPDGDFRYDPPQAPPRMVGLHDDTEPVLAGLTQIVRDGYATDQQRSIARAAYYALLTAEARGREEAATFARRLSDALLKVRPLGGSENFVRVGDEFYADPELLGREIEKLRADLHDIKSKYFTLRKEQAAIRRGTP